MGTSFIVPTNPTRLPFVLQTVSSITSNAGNGNSATVNYAYSDGLYDFPTREFRGFGKEERGVTH